MTELTGRKVAIIAVSAFGVIIAVNLTMAYFAVGTFPGLEVKSSYVASQSFDRERAAQERLGWDVVADVEGGLLTVAINDDQGNLVRVPEIEVIVGRATHMRDDRPADLRWRLGVYEAPMELKPGNWNIHMTATAHDGTKFRRRIPLDVKG